MEENKYTRKVKDLAVYREWQIAKKEADKWETRFYCLLMFDLFIALVFLASRQR